MRTTRATGVAGAGGTGAAGFTAGLAGLLAAFLRLRFAAVADFVLAGLALAGVDLVVSGFAGCAGDPAFDFRFSAVFFASLLVCSAAFLASFAACFAAFFSFFSVRLAFFADFFSAFLAFFSARFAALAASRAAFFSAFLAFFSAFSSAFFFFPISAPIENLDDAPHTRPAHKLIADDITPILKSATNMTVDQRLISHWCGALILHAHARFAYHPPPALDLGAHMLAERFGRAPGRLQPLRCKLRAQVFVRESVRPQVECGFSPLSRTSALPPSRSHASDSIAPGP